MTAMFAPPFGAYSQLVKLHEVNDFWTMLPGYVYVADKGPSTLSLPLRRLRTLIFFLDFSFLLYAICSQILFFTFLWALITHFNEVLQVGFIIRRVVKMEVI